MRRNFPDFMTAYFEYAKDGFCPDIFHQWTGISILAAALERKVWIPHEKGRQTFPNIYVFLISNPGMGKSSSMDIGVRSILGGVAHSEGPINFLPNQSTEAAFYQQMAHYRYFWAGEQKIPHSSGFLYLSEASNSLKEIVGGGSITASLTEFYDCPAVWAKKTVGAGELKILNLCCNALVGCTFDHLKDLIPTKNIMGGFASRLLYVVHDELTVRNPQWTEAKQDPHLRAALIEDLQEIHNLTGPFTVAPSFREAWRTWFPINDREVQNMKSSKMQALLARRSTNLMKLSMLCSISESSSMILTDAHWERALGLMSIVEAKLGRVLTTAYDKNDQASMTGMILQFIDTHEDASFGSTRRFMLGLGVESWKIDSTLGMLEKAGLISIGLRNGVPNYKVLVDPKDHI